MTTCVIFLLSVFACSLPASVASSGDICIQHQDSRLVWSEHTSCRRCPTCSWFSPVSMVIVNSWYVTDTIVSIIPMMGSRSKFWNVWLILSYRTAKYAKLPEVPQSPDVRLLWAFVVSGLISIISTVKMQEKVQRDLNSMTLTFALTFCMRTRTLTQMRTPGE